MSESASATRIGGAARASAAPMRLDARPRPDRGVSTMIGIAERASARATQRLRRGMLGVVSVAVGLLAAGCATQGDLLRLEEEVTALKRSGRTGADPFARIAQLSSDVDVLRQELRDLQGELELARKEAADALAEVRKTRTAVAQSGRAGGSAAADFGAGAAGASAAAVGSEAGSPAGGSAAALDAGVPQGETAGGSGGDELVAYQKALDAWRRDDFKGCIDQFTGFLQVHPSSSYADDAAYWLADCTYATKEYKRAVVRFNAVVNVYPDSPKAPDALYRQGESLLKLGPKFHEAARTVFKRVQQEYPDSPRAVEAERQLKSLESNPA